MKSLSEESVPLDIAKTMAALDTLQTSIEFGAGGDRRLIGLIRIMSACADLREMMYWYSKFGAQGRSDCGLIIGATVAEVTRELLPMILAYQLRTRN